MSTKVNLTKRILVGGKDRYVPVVQAANGRIKQDWVVIDGKEHHFPAGRFYIDWTENGRRRRESVGTSASNAVARQLRKETELKAISQGIQVIPETDDRRIKLDTAIAAYLDEIKLHRKPKTLNAYTTTLAYFQESCTKTFLEDIDRNDLLRYHAFLRDQKGQSPRSCRNKFANVMSFLKSQGITGLKLKKSDRPQVVEEEPEAYEREDLDAFFSVCNSTERAIFEFFLMTGMREQEVMHCTWRDINFKHNTVSMRWKPEFGWTPKAYREREIPVPSKLLERLKEMQPSGDGRQLLFPTEGGKPEGHFLRICKSIAVRAELDPDDWWLHKFRATFATWHLQAGVDLKTVQSWLGHKDLASTLRYLKAARGAGVLEKVNATFA